MKIIVTNVYSYQNKGDAAIVMALVSEVRRVFPSASITLLTADVEHDKGKYGAPVENSLMWILFSSLREEFFLKRLYELVMRTTGLVIYLMCCRLFRKRPSWILRKEVREYIDNIDRADMVIACGGGYLCTANSSPRSLLLLFGMCLSFLTGHYLDKPVYLYSQSIGPLHDRFARGLVRFSLNRVTLIEVREDVSMQYIKQLKIRTRYVHTADPVFLLKGRSVPSTLKLKPAPLQVGITVRNWFSTEAQLAHYVDIIARLVDYLVTTYKARVTYIPQVIASSYGDDDRLIAEKLRERIRHKERFGLLVDDLNPLELIKLCGEMDIFVGTRMHSNIFALLNDVPVVAIMYEHKTQGIMNGLGIGNLTVNIEKINYEELKRKVDMVISENDHYRSLIKQNMPQQMAMSMSAMTIIKQNFNGEND